MTVQINNSTQPISYKEIDVPIAANSQYTVQQPFNYIRILSSNTSTSNLKFRFGALSNQTELTMGVGLGIQEVFPSVTIQNVSNAPVIIRLAFAVGVISDDRLNVSGTVQTQEVPLSIVSANLRTFTASGELDVDSTGYKRVIIQNESATDSIYIFNNNTFEVKPGGTFDMSLSASFKIYGTNGKSVSVGLFG